MQLWSPLMTLNGKGVFSNMMNDDVLRKGKKSSFFFIVQWIKITSEGVDSYLDLTFSWDVSPINYTTRSLLWILNVSYITSENYHKIFISAHCGSFLDHAVNIMQNKKRLQEIENF